LQPTATTIQSKSTGSSPSPRPFLVPSKPISSNPKGTTKNNLYKNVSVYSL
jgi:hypothetical protein